MVYSMKGFENFCRKAAKAMSFVASIGVFLCMAVVVANIITRAAFNAPIHGTYEFVQYSLLLCVALALAHNELDGGNVRVTFLLEKMKPKKENIVNIVTTVIVMITSGFVTYNQFGIMITKYNNHAISGELNIPHWILVLILILGFITLTLAFALEIISLIRQHKTLPDRKLTADEIALKTGESSGNLM